MQRIRQKFVSSFQISGAGNSIRYVYKLAKEAIVSEIRMHVNRLKQANSTCKKTCSICLDDDINANHMFCVDKCHHRFCSECMKRHIEVRLLEGSAIRCPHYLCKSKLTFGSCANLLTPKRRKIWQQKIQEDSIPITKRIYCPNPRCSALMSVKKLSKFTKEVKFRRCCFECGLIFCSKCKVPWHSDLSCDDYQRLGPNPTADDIKLKVLANQNMWRQCGKCKHVIEHSEGCMKVRCRCGHKFCYKCGATAGRCCHDLFHIYIPMSSLEELYHLGS